MAHDLAEEDAIAAVLAEWRELRDRGEDDAAEALIRSKSELEASLRDRIAALSLVGAALGAMAEPAIAEPPEEIGDFRILREIGRGGMGIVYEAEQRSMRRRVALKLLHPSCSTDAHAVERFRREARAAGGIHHTHVVPVYALGSEGGVCWFAMELLRGRTLAEAIEARRTTTVPANATVRAGTEGGPPEGRDAWGRAGTSAWYRRVAREFAGVAEALEVAHRAGIVHRDVKPSNLILDEDGTLRLTDFGLAHVRSGSTPDLTGTGALLGTPAYMSPEQVCSTRGALDGRADVYSLGATLYEVLALRPPFAGKTVPEILAAVLAGAPAPPRRLDRRIPRELEAIVLKALEDRVERRYATAGALSDDLGRFASGQAPRARALGPLGRTWRMAMRHRVRTTVGLALLGLAVTTVLLARGREDARARHVQAESQRVALAYASLCEDAERAFFHGKRGAAELYARAIRLDPTRPDAHVGSVLVGRDPLPVALTHAEAAERGGLRGSTARLLAAHARIRSRDPAERVPAEDGLGMPAADETEGLPLLCGATVELSRGRVEKALHLLERVVRADSRAGLLTCLARRTRAGILLQRRDWELALVDLNALREAGDKTIDTTCRLCTAWKGLGRAEWAEGCLRDLLGPGLSHPEATWVSMARAFMALLEEAWADRAVAAGLAEHPRSAPLECMRGWALLERREIADAAACVERAAAWAPGTHDVACLHSAVLEAQGDLPAAERALRAVTGSNPCNGCAWRLARVCGAQPGRASEALRLHDDVVQRWPNLYEARVSRGDLLARMRRVDDAVRDYETAIALRGAAPAAHLSRMAVLSKAGRRTAAYEAATEALGLVPGNARVAARAGWVTFRNGRSEQALELLDSAIEIDPQYSWAHGKRGYVLGSQGEIEAAEAAFQRAQELDPRESEWCTMQGALLQQRGKLADALVAHDKAVLLDPKWGEGHARRASTLAALEHWRDAQEAAERALALGASDIEDIAAYALGLAHWHLGRPREALKAFERALTGGDDDPRHHMWRVRSLASLERVADAEQAYGRLLALQPSEEILDGLAGMLAADRPGWDGDGLPEDLRSRMAKARASQPAAMGD